MEESGSGGVWWCCSPLKMIVESLRIMSCNKVVFASIMLLTTLPLSTLVISQSISTHSLTSQIQHLEALAHFTSTRFEARHVCQESRHEALSLLRIKALFSLPSYLLSLAAALSSVHSTLLALHATATTTAAASLRHHSARLLATTIFVYAILFAFSPLPRVLAFLATSATARLLLLASASALEVYLMAVMSVALVVSVAEERFGWDAIRVGFVLMEGGRICGWVLSGLFVLGSSLIGSKLEHLMDGQDSIAVKDKASLIVSYGLLVLWSYVVITVFYCDCRKRHPIREHQADDDDLPQQQLSLINSTANQRSLGFLQRSSPLFLSHSRKDASIVANRTRGQAFQVLLLQERKVQKMMWSWFDPVEAKRLAAKQMERIKAKEKFKHCRVFLFNFYDERQYAIL
ncbi:hypothetical protein HKD37_13G036356 [Glycine soja]